MRNSPFFYPMFGRVVSNGWKTGFQSLEALLPMGRNNASDGWKQSACFISELAQSREQFVVFALIANCDAQAVLAECDA